MQHLINFFTQPLQYYVVHTDAKSNIDRSFGNVGVRSIVAPCKI